ncbi:uncharacterized protein RJT20DRAFT_26609 [Scheffersomyces xylosifermentans]|uniref:uncharacterized protein n=1 Tax=Scheffersomyces xylosifermentans TaxID=1304137 RepID=UPI00315DBF9B
MSQSNGAVFRSSVQEAVQATITLARPLFVFLSKSASDAESEQFLNQFLHENNQEIIEKLNNHFVLLKLVENTTEFGYFEQIFQNLVVPSFYIVSNGRLLDVVTNTTSEEEFNEKVIGWIPQISASGSNSSRPTYDVSGSTSPTAEANGDSPEIPITAPVATGTVSSTEPQAESGITATNIEVPEQRTETQPQTTQAEQHQQSRNDSDSTSRRSQERKKQKAKNQEKEEVISKHDKSAKKYHEQYRAKKKEQEREKERLRALLRADRKENQSRQRELEEKLDNTKDGTPQSSTTSKANTPRPTSDVCSLSIKLFDGNSLRHDFKPTDTLNDVRTWIDSETEIIPTHNSLPSFATSSYPQPTNYVFHRPMLPRITFTDEQELQKLVDLELCPRSALILKPIYDDKYTNAYPTNKSANGGIFRTIVTLLGRVGQALYSFFDYGVDAQQLEHPHEDYDEQDGSSSYEHEGTSRATGTSTGSSRTESQAPIRPSIFSIEGVAPVSASLISIASGTNNNSSASLNQLPSEPPLATEDFSTNPSNYNSRASTPKPSASGLSMAGRIQTIHGDVESSSSSSRDKDKKDVDTYNGNTVNLRKKKEDDE